MAEEQQDALTESEMADLMQKLKSLGDNLTPKEARFLTGALQTGIATNEANEVEGYTAQSALQGESVYYPSSYQQQLGGTQLSVTTETRVSVEVVGHFNAP